MAAQRADPPRLSGGEPHRGRRPPGGLGGEPGRSGPADASDLRPLRRPAARPARGVGLAAVRSPRCGTAGSTPAARRTTRGRCSVCSRRTRRCSTPNGSRRSTCTSSSRARRSPAAGSSSTCCAPSPSGPGRMPSWSATARTTRPAGPRCTPRSAGSVTPRSRSAPCSAISTPATYGGVAPNALETLVRILSRLKDADRRDPDPQALQAVEPPTKQELKTWKKLPFDKERFLSEEVTGARAHRPQGVLGVRADLGAADLRDPRHPRRLRRRRRQDRHPRPGDGQGESPAGTGPAVREGRPAARARGRGARPPAGPTSRSRMLHGGDPVKSTWTIRLSRCWTRRSRRSWGGRRFGCGPAARFRSFPSSVSPGRPVILTGIGLPDDGLHSPNEKLDLAQLWSGIQIFGRFFELFAEKGGRRRRRSESSESEGEARRSRSPPRWPRARPRGSLASSAPSSAPRCARAARRRR